MKRIKARVKCPKEALISVAKEICQKAEAVYFLGGFKTEGSTADVSLAVYKGKRYIVLRVDYKIERCIEI